MQRHTARDDFFVATTPTGQLLVISKAETPDTGWFLFRCDGAGTFESDTWHESVDAAKEQAAYEFEGLGVSSWTLVARSLDEAVAAARRGLAN